MEFSKINNLVVRLNEQTANGKVDWEVTASSERYLTTSASYSIIISEEEPDYFLTIMDKYDDLIERVSDNDLKEFNNDAYELMRTLYISARRNARGVDKAIDDILNVLG
jgi:hypothetical protein